MLFTNPDIIYTIEDAIIGGVNVKTDKICFMNYGRLVKNRILKLVVDEVQKSMKDNYVYSQVIEDLSNQMYEYLHFDYHMYPQNEEELAEQITQSYEYYNWIGKIYDRFMNTHKGVITKEFPIEVGGKNKNLHDFVNEIHEQDLYDVFQALSTTYNLEY